VWQGIPEVSVPSKTGMNSATEGLQPALSPRRVDILGVGISAIDMGQALQMVDGWVLGRRAHYVCVTPAHSVMDAHRDPALRRILNRSGLTTPDGMSLVWLLRLRGFRNVRRVYGPDLLLAVCRHGLDRGYRHFFYGGEPGVSDLLVRRLRDRFDGLRVAGIYTPPYGQISEAEDREIVGRINASQADIVWIGISTPKQEHWMADHLGRIEAPVMVGVGAAFDFLSGRKPQAPRWMQRMGLEWLFRLAMEPRRMWPRYRQYPKFVLLVLAQLLGWRHFGSARGD
jgi:N-acetylglucosaminyldiphosphoundecaprenol N-acetyl-beta-D-mannosaminyltransferase